MKLSKEQIAQIDETLVLNKVVYDDIKLELTDHIASDIEEIMTDKEVSYEEAFKNAFEKWKGMLHEETFHAFPILIFWKSAPKMVVDKWFKSARRQLLFSVLFTVITLILAIAILNIEDKESYRMTIDVFL